jgi:hypothetical protein
MGGPGLEPGDDAPEPGDTFALTDEGWQRIEYAEPDAAWRLRRDGAYESPDGMIRTWPLDQPTGE